jgi:single-stranded-DNA-specific exonuclease
VLSEPDKEAAAQLAEESGLNPFLALLLTTRGITDTEGAEQFLLHGEPEDDPFAFAGMDEAVNRIQHALDTGERMAVYGDYDADGVTATALLYLYLCDKQANVLYRIPKREGEGYGLHKSIIDEFAEQGVQLLITVDNGISAVEEVAYAASLGIDVVITDHHRPQEQLPAAIAVVDPHRADCESGFKDYAGVGVAFKLLCALEGDTAALLEQYADLVALGTLADVMPLRGENRLLVREGLHRLNEKGRVGLRALAEAAGISGKTLTSSTVLFTLAPRINAAGRMGEPDRAARLLMTEDEEEARLLAEEIQSLNTQRQATETEILKEVLAILEAHPDMVHQRVLVLEGENWHPGVIGIIAARVLELYGKPCIILSVSDDGSAKGSGRSIRGFSLFDAISACGDLLHHFGGHELAAGLSLSAADIPAFRARINAYAAEQCPHMPVPELHMDFKLRPSQIDVEKLNLLMALEPFGTGNAAPVFRLSDMRLDNITPMGGGKHLRLSLSRDGTSISAMKFRTTVEEFSVPCGSVLHAAVTLERNEFRGTVSPSVVIRDIRYADTDQEELIRAYELYDAVMRGEEIPEKAACRPSRDQVADVYKRLRANRGWVGTGEQLYHAIASDRLSYVQMLTALEVLRQAGLIEVKDQSDCLRIKLIPVNGKTDLNETPLMRFLSDAT